VASGGVSGAEGSVWLAVSGSEEEMEKAETLLESVAAEPGFEL
jgi:6-phosphogluconate dehydrogenase (decarboxylating)